jgi:hypothetical protein
MINPAIPPERRRPGTGHPGPIALTTGNEAPHAADMQLKKALTATLEIPSDLQRQATLRYYGGQGTNSTEAVTGEVDVPDDNSEADMTPYSSLEMLRNRTDIARQEMRQ